jgi:exopolysaccharide biosynthesis WecB/TagA/CpsF family protein
MSKTENTVDILGIKVNNLIMEETLTRINELIRHNKPSLIYTSNTNHIRLFQNDPEFAKAYNEADLITADGMPLIWISKLLGHPLRERISGVDLTGKICALSAERGYKIYLLGAAKGIAEKAKVRCEKIYPGVKIVGIYSPSREEILDDSRSRKIIATVNSTRADILCVAFGTPLQEKWLKKHRSFLKVPVSVGVGGTLDCLAGTIKRPPPWVRHIGMEWLTRLIQNPRHYGIRYLKDLAVFYHIFRELLKLR